MRDGGPNLGLPAIDFQLGPYWDEHYRRRFWYAQKAAWQRPTPPAPIGAQRPARGRCSPAASAP